MGMYEGRFSGRAAIVTGGGSGLGLAVATRMVAEGATVMLWDANAAGLSGARVTSKAQFAIEVDVTNAAAVAAATTQSLTALGRIDSFYKVK